MDLYIYLAAIMIGTVMVIVANTQKKKEGKFSRRSMLLLNAGAFIITFSLAQKLPEFIAAVINFWPRQ